MELGQLIPLEHLRRDFEEVAQRIAQYGVVYIIQDNVPKYLVSPIPSGVSALPVTAPDQPSVSGEAPSIVTRRLTIEEKNLMIRKLSSTGKGIFVTYYEHFKNQEDPLVFMAREDFTVQSKRARSSTARYIFRQGWQHHALRYIIQADRPTPAVIQQAQEILRRESAT